MDDDLFEALDILVRQVDEGPPEEPPEEIPTPTPTPTPFPTPTPTPVPPVILPDDDLNIPRPSPGAYILNEEDLAEEDKRLLHGRAFVVDRIIVNETDSGSPVTYYIAYDQVQGLVVPGRALDIENNGAGNILYRWTDDGEKWSSWITLEEGSVHDYAVDRKLRFAEIQIYASVAGAVFSMVVTR